MKLNSDAIPVMHVSPEWADTIPEDANLTFSILSEVVNGATILHNQVGFSDGFIYYKPTEADINKLLDELAKPMTALLDKDFRETHDVSDDWVLNHSITTRRGGGNINISLQREWLRILADKGRVIRPKVVHRGFPHRDHNETEHDWAFYQLARGTPGRILTGSPISVLDSIEGPWDIEPSLRKMSQLVPGERDLEKLIDFLSRWSFTAVRIGRTVLYRAQQLKGNIESFELKENTVYEMNGETVHWMPAHELSQYRAFYRDIVTRMYSKKEDQQRYENFRSALHPAGIVVFQDRAIGM